MKIQKWKQMGTVLLLAASLGAPVRSWSSQFDVDTGSPFDVDESPLSTAGQPYLPFWKDYIAANPFPTGNVPLLVTWFSSNITVPVTYLDENGDSQNNPAQVRISLLDAVTLAVLDSIVVTPSGSSFQATFDYSASSNDIRVNYFDPALNGEPEDQWKVTIHHEPQLLLRVEDANNPGGAARMQVEVLENIRWSGQVLIDEAAFNGVPEPGSVSLLALGAMVLGWRRWRG